MWIFAYNFKQLMDPEGPVESRLETQIAPEKLKIQSDIRNWPWSQKGKRRASARSSRGQASRIQKTGRNSLWLGLCLPLAMAWGWVNLILKVHELKGKPPLPMTLTKGRTYCFLCGPHEGPWFLFGHCYSQGAMDPLSWIHKASRWVRG